MSLLTKIIRSSVNKNLLTNLKQVRHGHGEWTYRCVQEPQRWSKVGATVVLTFTYWWFYWNLYHEFGSVIGYYGTTTLPNPKKWTDEELGIPSDYA